MNLPALSQDLSNAVLAAIGVCASFTSVIAVKLVSSAVRTRSNDGIREKKQRQLQTINGNWYNQVASQISEEDAKRIVNLTFVDLSKELHDGKITATKALHAYQYKVMLENPAINFMCEPIMEAKETALKLDKMSENERKKLPLFGIPISVKENYFLEGYDCTVGCVKFIDKPMKETSSLVKMLILQGAVPFIRTNIPQTCMSFDSTNPIYGVTCNPHSKQRSAGGSSGGEGAAVGCKSSILGFGSDIGGSIRIPAAFCGVYSLKPTAGRLTQHGDLSIDYNERIVTITCGPLGRDVDSLIASMKALSAPGGYAVDPYVPPITFNDSELTSTTKLRIGYLLECQPMATCAASKRAVNMAVNALKSQGHEVVEWMPTNMEWALSEAFATNLLADEGSIFLTAVENDRLEGHIKDTVYLSKTPSWLKRFLATALAPFFPKYQINYLRASCGSGSVAKLWEQEAGIKEYRRQVVAELRQQGIDALITPAMPIPAMNIGECKDAIGAMAYMGYFNLLNFPAGVVPITKCQSEDTAEDLKTFPPKDMFHKAMKSNLVGSEGLPMTIQVVSLPYHEERCLRIMKELESSIGYKV